MFEPLALLVDEGGAVRRVKVENLPATVGRDDDCDVVLADPAASRRHARFEATDHGCAVVDLDSSNGTLLDGVRVRRALLRRGAEIRIGDAKIVYVGGGPVPVVRAEPEAAAAVAAASPDASAARGEREAARGAGERAAAEDAAPAEPYVAPPPASEKTKAMANLLTAAILIGVNVGVYFVWQAYFRPEPKPAVVYVDAGRKPAPESRDAAPPDPDVVAAEQWRKVSAEVDELAAAEKFEGAFNLLKAFVSAHAGAPSAMEALERVGQVRRLRDEWVGNCLDNAEKSIKDGALSTARMSLDRARKIAGNEVPPRLTELAAALEAAAAKDK